MYNKEEVLKKVDILYNMWKKGSLGGEVMPECNKYFVDLTEEDRNRNKENYKEDDVIDFIVNNCSK